MNILLSSAGRRVELLQRLRSSLASLELKGLVVATDASATAPAAHAADAFEIVPRVDDPAYGVRLRELVTNRGIGLVVPTIDTELSMFAEMEGALRSAGAHVLTSGPKTVAVSGDKARTHEFLSQHDLPCPEQWSADVARTDAEALPYPVIIKPRRGSSSIGVSMAYDAEELRATVADEDIVEILAPGEEYTVDVWVDRGGIVRSAVPRRRIEVRAGEVSKGITERHGPVIELAERVASALPDVYGPLTIQIFADRSTAQVIEVNPRFGGGYPLSWEAGARTTVWAIQDALGLEMEPDRFSWQEGLTMLRYDQSIFIDESGLRR